MAGKILILKIGSQKYKKSQKVRQMNNLIVKIFHKLEYLAISKIKVRIRKIL